MKLAACIVLLLVTVTSRISAAVIPVPDQVACAVPGRQAFSSCGELEAFGE